MKRIIFTVLMLMAGSGFADTLIVDGQIKNVYRDGPWLVIDGDAYSVWRNGPYLNIDRIGRSDTARTIVILDPGSLRFPVADEAEAQRLKALADRIEREDPTSILYNQAIARLKARGR